MKIQKFLGISLTLALLGAGTAQASTEVTIYKSPTCGCCEKYASYLRENGFAVKTVNETNMDAIKKRNGVAHIASCHTALVNGYVVEGHVPVSAIQKMLKEKPAIIGISVPGMQQKGTLTVYAVRKEGKTPYVFSVE